METIQTLIFAFFLFLASALLAFGARKMFQILSSVIRSSKWAAIWRWVWEKAELTFKVSLTVFLVGCALAAINVGYIFIGGLAAGFYFSMNDVAVTEPQQLASLMTLSFDQLVAVQSVVAQVVGYAGLLWLSSGAVALLGRCACYLTSGQLMPTAPSIRSNIAAWWNERKAAFALSRVVSISEIEIDDEGKANLESNQNVELKLNVFERIQAWVESFKSFVARIHVSKPDVNQD